MARYLLSVQKVITGYLEVEADSLDEAFDKGDEAGEEGFDFSMDDGFVDMDMMSGQPLYSNPF